MLNQHKIKTDVKKISNDYGKFSKNILSLIEKSNHLKINNIYRIQIRKKRQTFYGRF